MTKLMTPERFHDRWEYFRNEPQQVTGVWTLYDAIKMLPGGDAVLDEDALWARKFSEAPPSPSTTNPLKVPYQSQLDNASGAGGRECYSSSCAMLAMYWGKVKNDDEYNRIRAKYGDTTSAEAQLSALRSLGLVANHYTTGNKQALIDQVNAGRPVAVGWLHHGPSSNPSGGGHWSVVIGYSSTSTIHNDPNGEADLVSGGYTSNLNGAGQRYSDANWLRRWEADGKNTGWYLTAWPAS
jgi:hypothetical protein